MSLLARITGSRWFRWGENLVLVGLLAFVAVRLAPQLSAWTGIGPTQGAVPAFHLTTLEGHVLTADDLRGRVTVVNFWATWCAPCRLEMPALQSLHEAFPARELAVVGISVDRGGADAVRAFLDEEGITYPVAMADGRVRRAFGGLSGIPTTFLIDRTGTVRHRVFGFFVPPALRAAVRRLVAEPDPALSPLAR